MSETTEQLRQQISDLDEQIAELRQDSDELRAQVGGRSEGAGDAEDTAAALTNIEENEAVLSLLEDRRETMRAKLEDD